MAATDRAALLERICAAAPSAAVWKNLDPSLGGEGDMDLLADPSDLDAIELAARSWLSTRTDGAVLVCRHRPERMQIVARADEDLVILDVTTRLSWGGGTALTGEGAASLVNHAPIRSIRLGAQAMLTLVLHGIGPWGSARPGRLDEDRLAWQAREDPDGVVVAARALGVASRPARRLLAAFVAGRWSRVNALLVRALFRARSVRSPRAIMARVSFKLKGRRTCQGVKDELGDAPDDALFERWLPRHTDHAGAPDRPAGRGRTVMIAGPDGVGKTSLVVGLIGRTLADMPVRRVHHRDGVGILPARAIRGDATEPHRHAAYPLPLAVVKVFYVWADIALGWLLRARPFVRRGGWMVMERAWWDLAVDPTRYRLARVSGLVRALGRLLPAPDLVLVLEAPSEVIVARKAELPAAELDRQAAATLRAVPKRARVVRLDATRTAEQVLDDASRAIADLDAFAGQTWVGLPPRAPRWWVPRGPRRAARAGLRMYHPMTKKGLLVWLVARAVARLGLFRFLPRATPPAILAIARDHLPGATTIAIARATWSQRFAVLGIDATGRETAVAKIALGSQGKEALAKEADALHRIRLPDGPVTMPALVAASDGVVVVSAVPWRPRLRPTALPVEVARAYGAMASAGEWAHGDAAPWNLMRTREGWALIDWEHAGPGRPFGDPLHFWVQAHGFLGRPRTRAIVAGLGGRGRIGAALEAYAEAAGLDPGEARARMIDALRAHLDQGIDENDPDAPEAARAAERLVAALEAEGTG